MKTYYKFNLRIRTETIRYIVLCMCIITPPCLATSRTAKNLVSEGNSRYLQMDYSGAKAKYSLAIEDTSDYAVAWSNLGLACSRLAEFDDAVSNISQAITLDPSNAQHYLNLGKVYAMQGQRIPNHYILAINTFSEAIVRDPNCEQAFYNRGWCHDQMGDYESAIEDYRLALGIAPLYSKAILAAAITKAKQARIDEAIWWCKRAIATSAKNSFSSMISALARRNLRILRGKDFEFQHETSTDLFTMGLSNLIHDSIDAAITDFSSLVEIERSSALSHEVYSRVIQEADPDDPNVALHYTAALNLLPEVTFSSLPPEKPLFLDYYNITSTDANMPLNIFPGTYDSTVKWLPYFSSRQIEISTVGSHTFVYELSDSKCLDISALLVSESSSNDLLQEEIYRIHLPSLMHVLTLKEIGVLSSSELNLYNMDILYATGFFGGEGPQYNAFLTSASPHIDTVKDTASSTPDDEFFEFTASGSFLDCSSHVNIDLEISWFSPYDNGSFVLRICPRQLKAYNPSPPDGAEHNDYWITLSWQSGETASSHNVYLGENFKDVDDGIADTFRGNNGSNFFIAGFPGFAYPNGLVSGTTYYWRIDEVEADGKTIHKGDVWRFLVLL